ncbi:MAG: Hpt domain-containing protein, partial [Alphaproteobacteria bacterium]|nr:Hpt domain-containing protein [Alphaproteobacteria bacterium]
GQPEAARRAAHAGRGAARMAGAMALGEAFQAFETALIDARMDEAAAMATRLRDAFARTEQAVAALSETDQPTT